jgi:hypothetical protein
MATAAINEPTTDAVRRAGSVKYGTNDQVGGSGIAAISGGLYRNDGTIVTIVDITNPPFPLPPTGATVGQVWPRGNP